MRFLTPAEVSRLASLIPEPYEALVNVLAYGGLRWGDAAALRRGRCQLLRARLQIMEPVAEVGGKFHFGPTKTYQHRSVAIPGFLGDLLAHHLAGSPDPRQALVFTPKAGGPLRHSNFRQRIWVPALKAAKLPLDLRIHDLRHTCAAILIAQGEHPEEDPAPPRPLIDHGHPGPLRPPLPLRRRRYGRAARPDVSLFSERQRATRERPGNDQS
jgi:integrase